MRNVLALLLVLSLSGCGIIKAITAPGTTPPAEVPADLVAQVVEATIALTTEDGQVFCSGVVAEDVFMTAAHCVDDGMPYRVIYNGKDYEGRTTLIWKAEDIAFLDAIGARVTRFAKMTEWEPTIGQKVVWLGYPLGLELYMGTGIVANPSSSTPFADGFVTVYGQFIPGNSGGPVFDEAGNLIGLVSSTLVSRGQYLPIGYVIPPQSIKTALESLD